MNENIKLRCQRADATLRMYEGALAGVSAAVAYAHLLRDACGTTPEQYAAASFESREYVLAQGCIALLRAACVSRKDWDAMPPYSPERAAVLLKGAARLGITTEWVGWVGPEQDLCAVCGAPADGDCASCDRKLCEEHRRTTAVPGDSFCRMGEGCSPKPFE